MSFTEEIINKYKNIELDIESLIFHKKSKTLDVFFVYGNNTLLSEKDIKLISVDFKKEFGEDLKLNFKFKKNYFDENILKNFLKSYIKVTFPLLYVDENLIVINGTKLIFKIEQRFCKLLGNEDFVKRCEEELTRKFEANFKIILELIKDIEKGEDEEFYFANEEDEEFRIELQAIEPYIGELIENKISHIASHKTSEDEVTICGKIKGLMQYKTKPKIDENGKEKPERIYYKFDIYDYTGIMSCIYFPTKVSLPKIEKLEDGSELVLYGQVVENNFGEGVVFKPKTFNLCILPKTFFNTIYTKPVPKKYKIVFPEVYIDTSQSNLFDTAVVATPCEALLTKSYVVFDLETTGVEYNRDKIIEIGAIKIENGKMTETFSCLIDPEIPIPPDATKVNHITDSDVRGMPILEKVMPDFYKFCDGSVMVSYVIDFDFKFIDFYAKQYGYVFKNETQDAFVLSKQKVKGLKNYKLKTVCEAMSVSLENAHRAVHDATATAELFIKLINM